MLKKAVWVGERGTDAHFVIPLNGHAYPTGTTNNESRLPPFLKGGGGDLFRWTRMFSVTIPAVECRTFIQKPASLNLDREDKK